MTYKIYGNFTQNESGKPVLVRAFGDSYLSLGFATIPNLPARDGAGDYRFMVGDELGSGDDEGKIILASFGENSPVRSYLAYVSDTMQISLKTFDKDGNPVDVGGHFSIELTLDVAQ